MQTQVQTASPIVNANPIVGENPIIGGSSIIQSSIIGAEETANYDFACGCSASIPPGSRVMFMKMALAAMSVGSLVVYGLFKLSEALGWM